MRKRIYLTAGTLALVASLAMASVASAGPLLGQTMTGSVTPAKQSKLTRGGANITVNVDTQYSGVFPFTGKAVKTIVNFDNDFAFFGKGLATCNPASIANTTTAQALAVCGAARVGSGNASLAGPVPASPGVVTAFNGPPSGGNLTILLHTRTSTPANTSILTGVLANSTAGGDFGKALIVTVPLLQGGFVITHFDTTVPKKKVKKARKGKPPKFYVSARCKDKNKTWNYSAVSTYDTGASTTATATQKCKPKG